MGYRLAVDLGTAFAAAAVVNGSDPVMVGLGNRTMQIPSVLFFAEDESFLVGEAAERRGLSEPGRLVREFKRRFGDPVPLLVGGVPYSAESLMARLLRWIVATTTSQQGEPPVEVILTHPANWGGYKRELLGQLVALAELPAASYCTEPEAAAVKYAARTSIDVGDRIAVYDLGGGTFDVCVLEKAVDGFAVLGHPDGIEHLGGSDIDQAMSHLVLATLESRLEGPDMSDPAMTMGLARLRRDCVEAKEALSADSDVTVPVALPGLNTTVRVTRAELEATIRPALQDTLAAFARTLTSAKVSAHDLKAVVLVGGSSRIPLVAEMLQATFKVPVTVGTHPKHDVVLGAALLCRDRHQAGSAARPAVVPVDAATMQPVIAAEPVPLTNSAVESKVGTTRPAQLAPVQPVVDPYSHVDDVAVDPLERARVQSQLAAMPSLDVASPGGSLPSHNGRAEGSDAATPPADETIAGHLNRSSAPSRPRSAHKRFSVMAAAILVLAAASLSLWAVLRDDSSGRGSTAGPITSISTSVRPTSSPSVTASKKATPPPKSAKPSSTLELLLAQIPPHIRRHCEEASETSVECDDGTKGLESVSYDKYDYASLMTDRFRELTTIDPDDKFKYPYHISCASWPRNSKYSRKQSTASGRVACYEIYREFRDVVWTTDDSTILAYARFKKDVSLADIKKWWEAAGPD